MMFVPLEALVSCLLDGLSALGEGKRGKVTRDGRVLIIDNWDGNDQGPNDCVFVYPAPLQVASWMPLPVRSLVP